MDERQMELSESAETVSDVTGLMRGFDDDVEDVAMTKRELLSFLDRIDAAAGRLGRAYEKQKEINKGLVDEVGVLKRALKPVLESPDGYFGSALFAVREAKRILGKDAE